MTAAKRIRVYLELGERRVFAGGVDWPGWCRSGRDETAALAALIAAGPRYARVLRSSRLGFAAPSEEAGIAITERLKGSATTDFGAPDRALSSDDGKVPAAEVRRLQTILKACWRAFDTAADTAVGKALRKGPRGGGRDLGSIQRHVLEAEGAYLAMLGRPHTIGDGRTAAELAKIRRALLQALADVAPFGTPPPGPRGGKRWSPRYFVRRVAWHALDHAWEIEDRIG